MTRSRSTIWLRRIGWMLAGIAALWTVAWFAFANVIESRLAQNSSPLIDACKDRDLRGFPFAFTLHCATFDDGQRLTTRKANVSLKILDPGRGEVELTSPATIRTAGPNVAPVLATWKTAALGGEMALVDRSLEELALDTEDLTLEAGPHRLTLNRLEATIAPRDESDMALRIDGETIAAILPFGARMAPFNLRGEAVLEDGATRFLAANYQLADVLRAGATLDVLELRIEVDGGELGLKGPLTLSPDGMLSGQVQIGTTGQDALIRWAENLGPQAAQIVTLIARASASASMTAEFGPSTMPIMTMVIERGVMRVGFITLGRIPPFKF